MPMDPTPQSKFRGDALDDSTREVRNFSEGKQGGGGGEAAAVSATFAKFAINL